MQKSEIRNPKSEIQTKIDQQYGTESDPEAFLLGVGISDLGFS